MREPYEISHSPTTRAAIRLGLVAAGLLAAVVSLELGVRVFASESRDDALPRGFVAADALLGWRLAPSRSLQHRSAYFDTGYATNTLGYRDETRSTAGSASDRVLLYGDSQVFGWGVPAELRFSNLVEAGSTRLEMWNLAVPGYGLDQQVLSYERDSAAWHADAVILFVSRFTQDRLRYSYVFGYNKPTFQLGGLDGLEMRPPAGKMARRLLFSLPGWMYTPYFLDSQLSRVDQRWRRGERVSAVDSGALLTGVLGFAATIGRQRGQSLFVISTRLHDDASVLRAVCADLGIGYLSIGLPDEQEDLVWGPYDAHWNLAANRRIAESLAGQLASADL